MLFHQPIPLPQNIGAFQGGFGGPLFLRGLGLGNAYLQLHRVGGAHMGDGFASGGVAHGNAAVGGGERNIRMAKQGGNGVHGSLQKGVAVWQV